MHGRAAGLTLLELMLVVALTGLTVVKLGLVLDLAGKEPTRASAEALLEDQARIVLDRLVYAVVGASRDSLVPDPEFPLFSDGLEYRVSLGVDNGRAVWSDPEGVGLSAEGTSVLWSSAVGTPEERRVVWCRNVRALLARELGNGLDDNGNELIDESGLAFTLDGRALTIRLTLESRHADGRPFATSVGTTVTLRN